MSNCFDILEQIGWPTKVLVLDFETYYDNEYCMSKDKLSTVEYVTDPRFEFLGLATKWLSEDTDQASNFTDGPDVKDMLDTIRKLHGDNMEKITVVVANAKFDVLICKHHCGFTPKYVIDVLDLSRAQEARARHNVADCAKRYGLKPKGDALSKHIKGLHFNQLGPARRILLGSYAKGDVDIEGGLFQILLPQLSRPAYEVRIARHTLKMFTDPLLHIDILAANELKADMMAEVDSAVSATAYSAKEISGTISFEKILRDNLPDGETPPMKMGGGKKPKLIMALAKDDKGREDMMNHADLIIRALMEARIARKSWPLHIGRIDRLITQAWCRGGMLGLPLKYHGCHTGRYSGEQSINPQNFACRGHELISRIKSILRVSSPFTLTITDLSAIEARGVAYAAGQDDLVDEFREGKDVYCSFASALFGAEVRKPIKDDSPEVAKLLGLRRFIGKQCILGLGYGMGVNRFFGDLSNKYPDTRELVLSGDITEKFVRRAVNFYRKKYSKIVDFWGTTEKAFRFVAKYPGTNSTIENAGLGFHSEGSTVYITLPSGRRLRYGGVRVSQDGDISWRWGHLWGGTIVENVVQAFSRDILTDALLKIEDAGLPVVLSVHDSIISVSHQRHAEQNVKIIEEIMTTPPDWYKGIPLDAESEISRVYK